MSLDFIEIRKQIKQMGENAPDRQQRLTKLKSELHALLEEHADELESLRGKLSLAVHNNPRMRSAVPVTEPLNSRHPLPNLPDKVTVLAADGSQINPDRHASLDFCLINVGAIMMVHGSPKPPKKFVKSKLFYDDAMYTSSGRMTERLVALMRDLEERSLLADLAKDISPPVITITDGPLELWIGPDIHLDTKHFEEKFTRYLQTLETLQSLGASTAGYVDKPRGDLIVRLLEIAKTPSNMLSEISRPRYFLGITDADLYRQILAPYERSAVFGIQSPMAEKYPGELTLRFFYLNIGKPEKPYLARIEIPSWVANSITMLDQLHGILVQQSQILGSSPYPYVLHRSHEVAVVSQDEKRQIEQMIALELRKRGLSPGEISHKQTAKNTAGRTSFRINPR